MNILIVEDEEILAKVIGEKFEEQKFKVMIVGDGSEVLDAAKKFKPDAILLDIILPKMNGLDVLEQLKKEDDLHNIPVILLSNLNEDDNIKRGLALGAVDYMVKTQHPVNEVIDRVKGYILKAR